MSGRPRAGSPFIFKFQPFSECTSFEVPLHPSQNDQTDLCVDLPVPELIHTLAARFAQAGISSSRAEAEWLLAALLHVNRSALYFDRQRVLMQEQKDKLEIFFRRRLQREPLQYILGHGEFYGREFNLSPAVLIPRPETELLVEKVMALARTLPAPRIVDLGTGSGCIAITLALEIPNAQIVALEVSAAALELARENARRLHAVERIEFLQADMCAPAEWPSALRCDMVVSNPPYVLHEESAELQPEVRDHEPKIALYVEGEGLKFYRCILDFCQAHLKPGGWAACEMASPRSAKIEALFRQSWFGDRLEIVHDYAGLPRHIIGQWQNK